MRCLLGVAVVCLLTVSGTPLPFLSIAPALAQDAEEAPIPMPRLRRADDGSALPVTERSALQSEAAAGGAQGGETPATAAISALTAVPQDVHLDARIMDSSPAISDGAVWRVFDTRTDASGELELVAKADTSVADLQLPPGEYLVHVAYGRAQASDSLTVAATKTSKTLVLDAGGLRLNAAVTGDIAIPANLVRFRIYSDSDEDDRNLVVPDLRTNDIVTLNAGTYHVVSYFGRINAVVRADLRVQPGQLTDATLYHKAGQVSFKLVSEPGGEAIADIDWTVKTAAGETVFTNLGAFPSAVFAEGDYVVLAKRGAQVFNRDFQVQAGAPEEIEVLTSVY